MNKKENQQFSDDRELQNRFTAYVQKAMENTRNTYYKKKMMLHEHEALYDEFGDTLLVESVHIPLPQSTLNRSRRAPKPRRLCTATADIVHRKSTHKQTPAETFPPQERREAQA